MSTGAVDPGCTRCRLAATRTSIVPGSGPASSKIMFIGEAPGRDEDLAGRPFVGRAGTVLTDALNEFGVRREDVYITNMVKCRPPGNRRPSQDEIDACRPYIEAEFEDVGPEVACILGLTAVNGLIGPGPKMSDIVGTDQTVVVNGKRYPAVVDYHPAACLYQRENLTMFKGVIRRCLERVGMA